MPDSPLPLSRASERLRGRPGRARKAAPASPSPSELLPVDGGHTLGTVTSQPRMAPGANGHPMASEANGLPLSPRLLTLPMTAAYLSLSVGSVENLIASGVLRPVSIPLGGRALRKLLFDREQIDALVTTRWRR